ncbi:hypothetical protein NUU61_001550 [Penicillium alfredii]|uniref:Uncharacterized protein n=1 Tax=Penicillium alfredii TaxID=1506179 RepID=A0A9W9G5A4_9EURO|nr:uncharacterized protein NUU61_001550 [Penicillium alfredii]KAJ5111920.1 hypothetical protein NUU61_001550 [Penicillium alfredii]
MATAGSLATRLGQIPRTLTEASRSNDKNRGEKKVESLDKIPQFFGPTTVQKNSIAVNLAVGKSTVRGAIGDIDMSIEDGSTTSGTTFTIRLTEVMYVPDIRVNLSGNKLADNGISAEYKRDGLVLL